MSSSSEEDDFLLLRKFFDGFLKEAAILIGSIEGDAKQKHA